MAQKGLAIGVVDPVYFTAVILLIVVSSVATPLALKAMFTKRRPCRIPVRQTKSGLIFILGFRKACGRI